MKELLIAKNLSKKYMQTQGFFSRTTSVINALDDISISITEGTTVAVVGESGSGKSTLAKSLIRLVDLDNGEIDFIGKNLLRLSGNNLKDIRKNIQMVFQDPYASLNPRMKVFDIINEPLLIHNFKDKALREKKIKNIITRVGLSHPDLFKYPHQFSGG